MEDLLIRIYGTIFLMCIIEYLCILLHSNFVFHCYVSPSHFIMMIQSSNVPLIGHFLFPDFGVLE